MCKAFNLVFAGLVLAMIGFSVALYCADCDEDFSDSGVGCVDNCLGD